MFFGSLLQGTLGQALAPMQTPEQQLHQAIEDNLMDKFKKLIYEDQVNTQSCDSSRQGCMPIHTACKKGNKEMIQILMQMNNNTGNMNLLTAEDNIGSIPLHYAAQGGHLETVKWLIEQTNTQTVMKRNRNKQTPYELAQNHHVRQYLLPIQLQAETSSGMYQPADMTFGGLHDPNFKAENIAPPPMMGSGPPGGGGGGGGGMQQQQQTNPNNPSYFNPTSQFQQPQQQYNNNNNNNNQPPQQPSMSMPPPPQNFDPSYSNTSQVQYRHPVLQNRNKASALIDKSVTRVIQADGFHTSVGNAKTSAKYGNHKTIHNVGYAPPTANGSTPPSSSSASQQIPTPTPPRPQTLSPSPQLQQQQQQSLPPPIDNNHMSHNSSNSSLNSLIRPSSAGSHNSSNNNSVSPPPPPPPPPGPSPHSLQPSPVPPQHPQQVPVQQTPQFQTFQSPLATKTNNVQPNNNNNNNNMPAFFNPQQQKQPVAVAVAASPNSNNNNGGVNVMNPVTDTIISANASSSSVL